MAPRPALWLVAVLLAGASGIVAGCDWQAWPQDHEETEAGPAVVVPEVVPIYPRDAARRIERAGLRVRYVRVPALVAVDTCTNGYAVRQQSPAAGTRVPRGAVVKLTLWQSDNAGCLGGDADGPVVVPGVVGLEANAAVSAVVVSSLLATVEAPSGPLDRLAVVSQEPAAGSVAPLGAEVVLRLE